MEDIPARRLLAQRIAAPSEGSVTDLVSHLGAMQAQDYRSALWAIGLRIGGSTEATVEQAIADRQIVRTWPMRGTLHFVAAADAHWMLELLTPRVIAAAAKRAEQHGLDEPTFRRCRRICIDALTGGTALTRGDLFAKLEAAGVSTESQRGYHIVWRLAQERLICFGPHAGKQPTFVLLDEWVGSAPSRPRADALRELAERYFTSHGPATLQDFVRWAGLKITDARAGIQDAELSHATIDSVTYWMSTRAVQQRKEPSRAAYLLPAFDEYLLGYGDRSAVLDDLHAGKIVPGNNGIFLPTVVVNGRVVGTWKRQPRGKAVVISVQPFAKLPKSSEPAIKAAAERYSAFVGKSVEVRIASA